MGGNVLQRHWKRREPSRKGDFTNCHFLRQKCRAGERFRSTSLVRWEKSITTWHGAIIAEGGTVLGGSASHTIRLVPMGWIQLLQTWSHERLALMLGFGHSEKFRNWSRRCANFSVGNILPAANLPLVNCRFSGREIIIAPHYHFLQSTFSSFPHLIVAFVLLI